LHVSAWYNDKISLSEADCLRVPGDCDRQDKNENCSLGAAQKERVSSREGYPRGIHEERIP
jgi:hypothetical protein